MPLPGDVGQRDEGNLSVMWHCRARCGGRPSHHADHSLNFDRGDSIGLCFPHNLRSNGVMTPVSSRRGIYRTKRPPAMSDDVQVKDVDSVVESSIPEPLYRQRGYQPSFEQLPWLEEYFGKKP